MLTQPFNTNYYEHPFFMSFLRQLNEVCQGSSLSSKIMGMFDTRYDADYRAVIKTLTKTQFQVDPDTRQPIRHLRAQWQHNNVRTTFQRPFSDTTVQTLSKRIPVLTKHQPEHNDRRNETSGKQSFTRSKIPQQREKNVSPTLWS